MQQTILLRNLTFSLMLFFNIAYSSAQTTKVAIISIADTIIVHQHVGTTIFANFTDTLHFDIAVKQYIEGQLKKYLSSSYNVSIVNHLPDSVFSIQKSIFSDWGGMRKEVKNWLTAIKNQYDFVIFIENASFPLEMNIIIQKNTSGLYTRGRTVGFYTTINFLAYRTSNQKMLEYYTLGGKLITPIKNFDLPEDKRTFTPEMLLTVKDGLIKHFDHRVEYFLTKTYLIAQNQIDEIKAKNP